MLVISLDLAHRLRVAGMAWTPADGDRFIVPNRDMDGDVFVISSMVVEVREIPAGRIVAFNGTTEWALDSVDAASVLWLPREAQLREYLGAHFVGLTGVPGGFVVTIEVGGTNERHIDVDAECAYARAVLSVLARS